ncbi:MULTISPECIES: TetR/AcrR family transcriptional regulator [unclassified Acinetobacter]|uniref:TetR/AcrR family transcriptional regulator n=1 Tax=unclassified Acinetobacter TaxID=196816 RepID=UPI0035BB4409
MVILHPTPTRADAKKSYKSILQAAHMLLDQYGAKINLDEIVQHSSVSRATFFRHFSNREQLMLALTQDVFFHIMQDAGKLQNHHDAFLRLLDLMIEQTIKNMFIFEYWWSMAEHQRMRNAILQFIDQLFKDVLVQAKSKQQCRADLTTYDIFLFGRMLIGSALNDDPEQRQHSIRRAAELLKTGFLSAKISD